MRGAGFDSVRDLWLRTQLPPKALEKLAHADAFGSLGLSRRDALWAVKALRRSGDKDDLPLFAHAAMPELEPDAHLPPMPPGQQVIEDYRHLHLSLKAHPVRSCAPISTRAASCRTSRLPDVPQRPARHHRRPRAGAPAAGHRQRHLHDAWRTRPRIANTIVWPRKFEAIRPVMMGARLISVTGLLQNEKGVIHIVADQFEDLTPLLRRLSERRRPTSIRPLPTDEIKRPVQGSWRHPRKTLSPVDMTAADNPDRFRHPRAGDHSCGWPRTSPRWNSSPPSTCRQGDAEGPEFSLSMTPVPRCFKHRERSRPRLQHVGEPVPHVIRADRDVVDLAMVEAAFLAR